jgi:hypothetical protein
MLSPWKKGDENDDPSRTCLVTEILDWNGQMARHNRSLKLFGMVIAEQHLMSILPQPLRAIKLNMTTA